MLNKVPLTAEQQQNDSISRATSSSDCSLGTESHTLCHLSVRAREERKKKADWKSRKIKKKEENRRIKKKKNGISGEETKSCLISRSLIHWWLTEPSKPDCTGMTDDLNKCNKISPFFGCFHTQMDFIDHFFQTWFLLVC